MIYNKAVTTVIFSLLIIFLLINVVLVAQYIKNPDSQSSLFLLTMIFGVGCIIYISKQTTGKWSKNGILLVGLTILSISLVYMALVLLPSGGLISELIKMSLVVLCSLGFIPLIYHFGHKYQSESAPIFLKYPIGEYTHAISFSKIQILSIWCALAILFLTVFALPVFLRSDIIGWDTSTYVFRARLLESYGLEKYAQIGGGYQITFPLLSVILHRVSGLDYFDIVRLLPPFIMAIFSVTSGYLGFLVTKSQPFAILTSIFSSVWSVSPYIIANWRDNAMVLLFGVLVMICLAQPKGNKAWIFEILQLLFLILAGLSHITLSIIFFLTVLLVNLLEFYDAYWLGERKFFFHKLVKAVGVPVLAGLVVLLIWSPVILELLRSLGFGLRIVAEAGEVRDNTVGYIINRYMLIPSIPWILIGLSGITWISFTPNHSKGFKVGFVWSILCIYLGIILQPISYLNDRLLMMAPFYLLIPFGAYIIWNFGDHFSVLPKLITKIILVILFLGMLIPYNLVVNAKKLSNDIQGFSFSEFIDIKNISKYLETHDNSKPIIFLVENTSIYAEAFSTLWYRNIQSSVPQEYLDKTYIYFGTLDYLISREVTPPSNNGLPKLLYSDIFSSTGQRWFDELVRSNVLENQEMTVFIHKMYNPDIYSHYEYLPIVDEIGPGILVVNIRDENMDHKTTEKTNP